MKMLCPQPPDQTPDEMLRRNAVSPMGAALCPRWAPDGRPRCDEVVRGEGTFLKSRSRRIIADVNKLQGRGLFDPLTAEILDRGTFARI